MRCILDHQIAFPHRLPHKTKLSVFEITNAAMRHVARGRTGPGTKIAALHKQNIHPIQGQVTECANAIDTSTNNQYRDLGLIFERSEDFVTIHRFSSAFPVPYSIS